MTAREFLAAEYDRRGWAMWARNVRQGHALSHTEDAALAAIEAALRPQPDLRAMLEKARDRFRASMQLHNRPTLWQYDPELAAEYSALADEIDRALSGGVITTAIVTGYRGSIEASAGDKFAWHDGSEWEIVGFTGRVTYSPSGLGGCPIVVCRHLSGPLTGAFAQYAVDGFCDWCGDSIATALINSRSPS